MNAPDRPPRKSSGPPAAAQRLGGAHQSSLRDRIAARDEQALVELVHLATPWLLGVAEAMLHDRDEAEDVVMETFRTVWDNMTPASDSSSGLMPYLLRITRHRSIDRLRGRRRRERMLSLATPTEWSRQTVAPTEPDEAGHPGWQVHAQVHAALAGLPDEQLAAVQLAYFQGLTQSEIAAQLGIPLGTVKTRLRLAFIRLRTTLAGLKEWVL